MTRAPLALASVALVAAGCTSGGSHSRATTTKRQVVVTHPRRHHAALPSPREQRRALRRLVRIGYPVYCGGRRARVVALTFDDGPGAYTPIALRMLRRAHARATFFLVGKELQYFPGYPRRETSLAALGDHTWTHSFMPHLSAKEQQSELARTKQAVVRASGARVMLYRPPYGARSPAASAAARRLGLVEVVWSVDSRDSEGADPPHILANVTAGLHPGAIVLMHENRGQTLKALKAIMRRAKQRQLRMLTLPELLTVDPPSRKQLRLGIAGCSR